MFYLLHHARKFPALPVFNNFTICLRPTWITVLPILPCYQLNHYSALASFTIFPFESIPGLVGFNIVTIFADHSGLAVSPFYQFFHFSALNGFAISPLASISGPVGFNIFAILLSPFRVYRFTDFTILPFYHFSAAARCPRCRLPFYHFTILPFSILPFYHFAIFP